ncbi:MAG: PAS domain S-box protein [Planctomycetes bacterium]|nr:PAS domain S-box protein [Planctomycetota bacterium]
MFPAAAVFLGVMLQVVVPTVSFAFVGGLLAVALVALWLQRPVTIVSPIPKSSAPADALIVPTARVRLLESAVVHAHDAVVILEAQPRGGAGRAVLYVNDAFCRMTGYEWDEVVGRSLHFLRGPGSDPDTLDAIREALTLGRPLQIELRNYRKDGAEFWVDLSLVPVPDPAGQAAHWVMIQRDITDRKKAVDAVRRSEALFRGVFETAPAGVALTNAAGKYVECNPTFAAMVGRTPDELSSLTPDDIVHPDDLAEHNRFAAEVLAGTLDRYSHAKRYVRPDGEVVWVEFSFAAIRGTGGRFEYGLGVSLNVTERRKLEDQLRHAQKMEAVGQMAGGVAHDFNNLLTAVMCNLALVRLPENHPQASHLAAAEQAVVRAAELTGKLLGYARRNQLVSVPVPPEDAFREAVGLLRHTLDPRIQMVVNVAPDCGPIQADPALLSQVLLNLCLNARDAMPTGGTLTLSAAPVEVTEGEAATQPDEARPGPFIRLSVQDTGFGMTDEVKARLFEPFFTTKGIGKGTGLGLPMVQGIVKQHRGWVTFTSTPGIGTKLDMFFPPAEVEVGRRAVARSWHTIAMPDVVPTPPVMPQLEPVEQLTNGTQTTILLVDDESMIRDIGQIVLERAGYRVLSAEDGAEAVEVFAREHAGIDLVVLDVTMPRMSGRDAFRRMVEIAPDVKVLFSTGYSSEDIAELDGSVGLLGKPYRAHELLAAVQTALQGEPLPTA